MEYPDCRVAPWRLLVGGIAASQAGSQKATAGVQRSTCPMTRQTNNARRHSSCARNWRATCRSIWTSPSSGFNCEAAWPKAPRCDRSTTSTWLCTSAAPMHLTTYAHCWTTWQSDCSMPSPTSAPIRSSRRPIRSPCRSGDQGSMWTWCLCCMLDYPIGAAT